MRESDRLEERAAVAMEEAQSWLKKAAQFASLAREARTHDADQAVRNAAKAKAQRSAKAKEAAKPKDKPATTKPAPAAKPAAAKAVKGK